MKRHRFALRKRFGGGVLTAVICAACSADAAAAQAVAECDTDTQLKLISAPLDQNIRHYANGNILIAVVDDGRSDVGSALSVLVLSPPFDAHGERQCRRVSLNATDGFAALLMDRAVAAYDPSIGLTVSLPAVVLPTNESLGQKVDLAVTINQATGIITPVQIPNE